MRGEKVSEKASIKTDIDKNWSLVCQFLNIINVSFSSVFDLSISFWSTLSVLISHIKSGRQFKINGHRLKPYWTLEPAAFADMLNLHLRKDVTLVSPSSH